MNDEIILKTPWISKRITHDKVIKENSMTVKEIAIAEEFIPIFCKYLMKVGRLDFEIDELIKWLLNNTADTVGCKSKTGSKADAKVRYPDRPKIVDVQNLCYHLANAESFWIESRMTGKRIDPIFHVGELHYRLRSDWERRL